MWLKPWIIAVLGMALIWGMAPVGSSPASTVAGPRISAPQVIRFRVIANSDNPIDQAIKLDVRDRILETLDPELNGVKSRRVAELRIRALRGALSRVANQVLTAHHVGYRARVEWTRTVFPTKAYGSWVLPAGRYQALLIVLGRGAGHNWWCVLFPSLCFIDMGNALAVPVSTTPISPAVAVPPAPIFAGGPPEAASRHVSTGHAHKPSGRIRVSWTTPRFFATLLAILR